MKILDIVEMESKRISMKSLLLLLLFSICLLPPILPVVMAKISSSSSNETGTKSLVDSCKKFACNNPHRLKGKNK